MSRNLSNGVIMLENRKVARCEVEFKYANGVPGHGPIKTLRVCIDGNISNSLAREVLEEVEALGWRKYVHDVCIVGDAPDWPQAAADKTEFSKQYLSNFLETLSE